jgi:hypothetical protein
MYQKKRILFFILIVFITAILNGPACQRSVKNPSAEFIIAKEKMALDRWAKGDPYGYIELAAEEITYFAEGIDTLVKGFNAFEKVNAAVKGKVNIPRFEMRDPKVQLHGEVGILTFVLYNYSDKNSITSRWKSTEVYLLENNDWKLIHSHWTVFK